MSTRARRLQGRLRLLPQLRRLEARHPVCVQESERERKGEFTAERMRIGVHAVRQFRHRVDRPLAVELELPHVSSFD